MYCELESLLSPASYITVRAIPPYCQYVRTYSSDPVLGGVNTLSRQAEQFRGLDCVPTELHEVA